MENLNLEKQPTIDYMLRTTWNAVVKSYNTEALKHDITMAKGFTLISIDPKCGTSSTALGPRMGMEPTSLSRTLKNLEKDGFIERHPNPNDGRGVIVTVTEKGAKYRKIAESCVLKFNSTVTELLGEEKVRIFKEVCHEVQQILDNNKINTD